MTYYDLVANLFLQIAVIICVCRVVVFIGKRYFNQTEVVCEMVAGLILGPSIFGAFFPEVQHFLFPAESLSLMNGSKVPNESMTLLFALSQIGVVLYMFLTGLEFSTKIIQKNFKSVSFICSTGIVIPFIMGAVFISLIDTNKLIVDGISMKVAMIYFGAAISITAFPVLARILDEKQIAKTSLGRLALASASLEDAIAWCLVALILTITESKPLIIFLMLGGTILYVFAMIVIGKLLKKYFSQHFNDSIIPTKQTLSIVLVLLMLCAVTVDKIGLYSAFGAFVAGAIMPKGKFAETLKTKFGYLTVSFLLPIFFTFTGLNTKISLINTPMLWLITGLIIVVALVSKLVTCTISAHVMGIKWKESMAYGVLMNTRGLMELVILNIGLQHHIISITLFTMMVIMTLVTTLMTSPLVSVLLPKLKEEPSSETIASEQVAEP